MLKEQGHEVILYKKSNHQIKSKTLINKLSLFVNTVWSISSYIEFHRFLKEHNPDIVHFHNFFPIISPSAYYACKKRNIPVVQTIHNYRLICPAATFLREGKVCEKCLHGSILNSVKYGCYRGSRLQTLPIATMITVHKLFSTWTDKVSHYIALTEFSKKKIAASSIPPEKITVKPNFLNNQEEEICEKENYILYVGRLSYEKGIEILLNAWQQIKNDQNTQLLIIGDGPQFDKLRRENGNAVFLGKQSSTNVIKYMQKAKYLIVPSIWYEGFPMTIIEAYSVGTPVICSKIGSLQEVVRDSYTGFHFQSSDVESLRHVLEKALSYKQHRSLCVNSHDLFKSKYSKQLNYDILIRIYQNSIRVRNRA